MSYLIPSIKETEERTEQNTDLLFSDPNTNYPFIHGYTTIFLANTTD